MKRLIVLSLLFFTLARPVFADNNTPNLSVSDAVYADLALRHYLDNVSVYYADGKTENDIKVNEERHWIPASTVKTFAAMYAYKLISEGKLNLRDRVVIDAKNNVPTELVTDELPTFMDGDSVTLDRLLLQMITQSDNTAFNVLLDILGRDKITTYIQSLGLTRSRVGSKLNLDTSQEQYEFDVSGYGINTTTAQDYAKAFELIKKNKIPGAKEMFAVLKKQKINTMIPFLLPKDVQCAHKTGDLDPLYHDGGICLDKKRSYVLAIFTNAGDPNLLAHLSKLIYTKNYDLVGESLGKKLEEETKVDHPLDPLVMNPVPLSPVLGASASSFPIVPITADDLGVTANDLSLVIRDRDLPTVFIPADSSFHIFSDAMQIIKSALVSNPKAKQTVYFETAKLRLAEAKDLLRKGKVKEAYVVLEAISRGLKVLAKTTTTAHDPFAQNTIQAISETRFAILGDELKKAKNEEKLALIKNIGNQAKDTLQNIQPNIPDATNATNPSQKPLIGEIVDKTTSEITVKTAGGQEVIIPINNASVIVKDKGIAPILSPIPTQTKEAPVASPTPPAPLTLSSLAKGTTVALVGSTTNNTFSPTLVLANIPRELAAPQPVTVVKVDTKHNTMVVIENGVYTQVNISKDTNIRGADTDIPLKEIKPGDIVVVHGEPLKPTAPITPPSPTKPLPEATAVPGGRTMIQSAPITPPSKPVSLPGKITPMPQNQKVQNSKTTSNPPVSTQKVYPVIKSTSVQLIEKKENIAQPPPVQPASQPKSEIKPQPQNPPPEQPKSPPPAVQSNPPPGIKSEGKKK